MFETVAIIGLGMIGSSLAHDLRAKGLAKTVIGVDPVEAHGALLLTKGLLQEAHTSMYAVKRVCDLVILACPPSVFEEVAKALPAIVAAGSVITDAASVKAHVVDVVAPYVPHGVHFIPAHPIAGKAESGAMAGEVGLFVGKRVILTPYEEVGEAAITKVLELWQGVGGVCEIMDAAQHDRIYAHVSHLPQMVAYASCLALREIPRMALPTKNITNFLRLGASSPALWVDIAMHNREPLHEALHTFLYLLNHMIAELSSGEDLEQPSREAKDAALTLLPRIVASLVISSVIMFEKKQGIKAVTYAGTGFADVTAPAMEPPEGDIERISGAYAQVAQMLRIVEQHFRAMFLDLEHGQAQALFDQMAEANLAHQHLVQTLH